MVVAMELFLPLSVCECGRGTGVYKKKRAVSQTKTKHNVYFWHFLFTDTIGGD
jgi:hypothetical protein